MWLCLAILGGCSGHEFVVGLFGGVGSKFDDVAIGVSDVGERSAGCVFAAPDQSTSCRLYSRDRVIVADPRLQAESEVLDAAALAGQTLMVGVEGDRVRAAWSVQEHEVAVAELLAHPEHLLVEAKRTVEIAHAQVDVGQALGLDHGKQTTWSAKRSLSQGSQVACGCSVWMEAATVG